MGLKDFLREEGGSEIGVTRLAPATGAAGFTTEK